MVNDYAASRYSAWSADNLSQTRKGAVIILLSLFSLTTFPFAGLGGGGAPDAQTFSCPQLAQQCGAAQCQLVNAPPSLEVPGCIQAITFPTAFTSVPTKYGINTQCLANTAVTVSGKTAEQACSGLVTGGHMFTNLPIPAIFQSDNGETWTSMPVAKTELYGNPNHETTFNNIGVAQLATFSVNCMTGSTGTSAILRPEFLSASGWFPVAAVSGQLDAPVSSTSSFLCGSGSGSQLISVQGNVNTTLGSQTSPVALRVVGVGGSGVGDNPVFNNIVLTLSISIPLSIIPSIGNPVGCPCVTKTTMNFYVTAINPNAGLGNLWPIFSWWACIC